MPLDAEGFEALALAGCEKLLANARLPVILFESNGSAERYGISSAAAGEFLMARGYVLGMYRHDRQEFDATARLWDDVLAVTPDGLRALRERMPSLRLVGL